MYQLKKSKERSTGSGGEGREVGRGSEGVVGGENVIAVYCIRKE